jgi:rfaE bifunctional protein kinase chain/domain
VVKVERLEERLGGAANVARNAAALGGIITLLSVVGDDEAGRSLGQLLSDAGIQAGLQIDRQIDTTVKLRVIGRQQQLLRIDFETTPSHEVLRAKLEDFEERLQDCDVVVLSDYGKGGLTHIAEMIRLARAADKPVLVDPKGDEYAKYAGATIITPNRSELRQVVGRWGSEEELATKAQTLRRRLGLDALLYRDDEIIQEAAQAREVFDVSGAGDTVIATLAMLIAAGASWDEAVRVANLAAGIVVGKLGTAVVTRHELESVL